MKVRRRGIFRNIYELNDWVYTITGYGFIDSPVMWHQILYRVYSFGVGISCLLHFFLVCVELISVMDDIPAACYVLTYVVTMAIGMSRSLFVHSKVKTLRELGGKLDNDFNFSWAETEKWDLIKRKNRKIMVYATIASYGGTTIAWIIFSLIALVGRTPWLFVLPTPRIRFLERFSWVNISMTLIQYLGGFHFVINFVCHELILFGLILRLGEQLDIIENRLKAVRCRLPQRNYSKFVRGYSDYPDDSECVLGKQLLTPEKIHVVIVQCIKHHQAINESLYIMQSVYSRTFFVVVYMGALVLGLTISSTFSNGVSKALLLQEVLSASLAVVTLFAYCNLGTRLTEKFENVRFAFYSCPWYELGGNTRRMLTFVLLRLQTPGKLRAGNVADVSLETYLWMMKFCYNMVTFLYSRQ